MLAALDDPASQGLARDVDVVMAQHFFKTMKRQTVHVLGGQHAGAGHAFFDQLGWFVRCYRCALAVAAAAHTGQFMFGQFMDDFDARQIGRQWLAFTASTGR
ncbi:hypothetical protein D3C75_443750 [compost metagenome]